MINDFAVYQLIVFGLCFILIIRTVVLFFRREKTIRELFVAVFIWGGIGLVGLYPNLTDYIAKVTGFQLGINALLVISTIILFYQAVTQSLKNDKLENTITRIVRHLALKELNGKSNAKNEDI